ncbi:MAG: family 2A encapsulin nanocompartment cargo protein cysteine desulfurase [Rhodospirillales bacterium]
MPAIPSSATSLAAAAQAVVEGFPGGVDAATLSRWASALVAAVPGGAAAGTTLPRGAPSPAAAAIGSLGGLPPGFAAGETAAARVATGAAAPAAPASAFVAPAPAAGIPLPGEAELRAILAAVRLPAAPSPSPSFYFLDATPTVGPVAASSAAPPPPVAGIAPAAGPAAFDVNAIRRDFPILQEQVHGRPLIWLDSAATTQKPQAVIDRIAHFYRHENSNIHRAAHALAARATDAYEAARDKVRRFLNASSPDEIVFTRGATEAINLVAQSWGRKNIKAGDEIVVTWLEHHANIVPWQQLCTETGARLRVVPVDDQGQLRLDAYEALLGPKTRLVAFSHVSNALGTVTPARQVVEMARRSDARVLVDGAQAVSHMRTDVQALDCDWYVFSGHKLFGPTGIGALFGKADVLEAMPPWQGGGNMISDVTFEKTEYQAPAARFEAGTGNIADAVGLGAAIDYVEHIGMEAIGRYEHELLAYATRALARIPGLRLIGTAAEKAAVLSFVLDGIRSEDVGTALDREGIAVRAGHHCAQPILRRFGVESTVRPSLAFYNTFAEIDALAAAVLRIRTGTPLPG